MALELIKKQTCSYLQGKRYFVDPKTHLVIRNHFLPDPPSPRPSKYPKFYTPIILGEQEFTQKGREFCQN